MKPEHITQTTMLIQHEGMTNQAPLHPESSTPGGLQPTGSIHEMIDTF